MSTLLPRADAIAGEFWRRRNLVLVAEPGAGKTTALPPALLRHPRATPGQVWVLQPRRLAARLAARYVAETMGTRCGGEVGYRIRFDDCTQADTRLVYLTDGMLRRQLAQDPTLAGVAAVVFDEFHERSLAQDVGLATLVALRNQGRLRAALGVMSATLDHAAVCRVLGDVAPTFVAGRTYPVAVDYLPHRPRTPLPQVVARALAEVLQAPMDAADAERGNVLVFLPGTRAIAACLAACAPVCARYGLRALPLHASLPPAAQALPFATDAGRLVIFATNVAETSLTLPNVRTVLDAGRAKQARQLPLTGLTELVERDVSQASAVQRAGRAGRVAPGRCLRLYTAADFRRRPAFDPPEVARLDLATTSLDVAALALGSLQALPTVDPVDPAAAGVAQALLLQLGAVAHTNGADAPQLTPHGRAMAALGLHPRLAALVLAADAVGIGRWGCAAATALSEAPAAPPTRTTDAAALTANWSTDSDLDPLVAAVGRDPQLRRVADGLWRTLQRLQAKKAAAVPAPAPQAVAAARARAVLAGFGDRVAKCLPASADVARRASAARATTSMAGAPGPAPALALARGGRAVLAPSSQVRGHDFVVVLRAEASPQGPTSPLQVRCAVGLGADDLLAGSPALLDEQVVHSYDATRGRIMVQSQLRYDGLVLLEDARPETNLDVALPLLLTAFRRGPGQQGAFVQAIAALAVRLRLAATLRGAAAEHDAVQAQLEAAIASALRTWAEGGLPLTKLDPTSLLPAVRAHLPPEAQRALQTLVPDALTLRSGKRLTVHYPEGAAPYVESYLQDFFGGQQAPSLAGGKLPLTVHLLGPNRRPLQVTADLPGFWRVHYPKLRPALARRYPRHTWPEDPLHAAAVVRLPRPRRS